MSNTSLLVDDSTTIRSMMMRTIKMIGLNVDTVLEAGDGIEALAQFADHEVDVVLMDINMPRMSGVQLLTRMKESERLKHIPIVVASTDGSEKRMEQLRELGVVGYVRKPFQPEQLRDVLVPILGVTQNAGSIDENGEEDIF